MAMDRLDLDECIDGDLIDVYISDEQYNSLVQSGLIGFVNNLLGVCIDEYEDEKIVGRDALDKVRLLIDMGVDTSSNGAVNGLLSQVNKAIEYNTGVFFYF